ncbi:c-Myc-binding protein homolog [Drosophila bipectinata]|uniref:c-Myc-binding protein homolog n=1 Tax=Drosophila bipectinata TaxID=42026 RepID=UPI001C88EC3C|nr:c-Myc-binding protein homolog [Drosophila bipectinata]
MSFKPIDPKRDEIRRYLERGSVLDSLTKIFIRVIKERPENPLEYIRNNIGVVRHQHDKYERLQQDLQIANDEIQRLRDIINSINPDVLKGLVPVAQAKAPESSESQAAGGEVNEPVEQQKNGVPEEAAPAVQELSAAVETCQIEEKKENESPAVPAAANPSPTSVQIEANTSTDNTE